MESIHTLCIIIIHTQIQKTCYYEMWHEMDCYGCSVFLSLSCSRLLRLLVARHGFFWIQLWVYENISSQFVSNFFSAVQLKKGVFILIQCSPSKSLLWRQTFLKDKERQSQPMLYDLYQKFQSFTEATWRRKAIQSASCVIFSFLFWRGDHDRIL